MGVHQKIDRVARRHIESRLPDAIVFPRSQQILHFEGKNGPDGIKRKSPSIDEPWHFIDPEKIADAPLLMMIEEHRMNLVDALRQRNAERAAFEAAWMAHAITDGLTPAHHFPLEDVLEELREGEGLETRNSLVAKNIMKGATPADVLKNNWRYWGAKGAMTTHLAFEMGIASVVAYQRFADGAPTDEDVRVVREHGFENYFVACVRQVASLGMYDAFIAAGWTTALAKQTNKQLMPLIIRAVTLGWLSAVWQAEEQR